MLSLFPDPCPPVTIRAMSAGSLPVRVRPAAIALGNDLPSVAELFAFMRDAELRFETLRMTVEEHSATARGEEIVVSDVALRHPGQARILVSRPSEKLKADYEVWATDGKTIRTYVAERRLGTNRPVRGTVRGLANEDLPATARTRPSRTPLQSESIPEVFLHPAGYTQNVLSTGRCSIAGLDAVAGREAIVVDCVTPRTAELAADRQDFAIRIWVDRRDGVILRLQETLGGQVTRDAITTTYRPNAELRESDLAFTFPPDTTFIY